MDKKDLKRQYKETVQPMGVYQIRNLTNGKIFLGSSTNLPGKFNSIRLQLQLGTYINKELQSDYTRLGEQRFAFEILDQLEPKEGPSYDYRDDIAVLEQMWREKLQPFEERGYHRRKTVSRGVDR
jgi:hypothetical protein